MTEIVGTLENAKSETRRDIADGAQEKIPTDTSGTVSDS